MRAGFITKDAQGNWYDSTAPQPEAPAREVNQPVPFDPEVSTHLDALRSVYGEAVIDGAMARAISDLAQGKDSSAAVNELSRTIGVEPEEGYDVTNGILRRLQDSLFANVEAQSGVSGDTISEWFFSTLSPDMRSHFLVRAYHGDRLLLKDLIGIYQRGDRY